MESQIFDYIKKARDAKASDDDIRSMLLAGGWPEDKVKAALGVKPGLPIPPPPPPPASTPPASAPLTPVAGTPQPIAVVHNLSNRGFEFIIMFIALGITASSLGWILHSLADGVFSSGGSVYEAGISFASAALLVGLPVFGWLFLRLKKAELNDPEVKKDPSRRRAVQLTLVVTFLIGMSKVITYLFTLFNGGNGSLFTNADAINPLVNLVHTFITLGIAGGIFVYYWLDQRKPTS